MIALVGVFLWADRFVPPFTWFPMRAALGLLGFFLATSCFAADTATRPNVVLFLVDDTDAASVGVAISPGYVQAGVTF